MPTAQLVLYLRVRHPAPLQVFITCAPDWGGSRSSSAARLAPLLSDPGARQHPARDYSDGPAMGIRAEKVERLSDLPDASRVELLSMQESPLPVD